MASQGKYPNGIVLLRRPQPLQAASRSGSMVLPDQSVFNVWDFLEPVGVKKGIDDQSFGWLIVVVNSLPAPLVLEKINLISGTQIGYAAITDFSKAVDGTEDQIPGVQNDPTQQNVQLTGAGAWTFTAGGSNSFEIALRFSYRIKSGDPGKAIGITVKDQAEYKTDNLTGRAYLTRVSVSATTADLDSFATPETDESQKVLQAFFDQKADNQAGYSSSGSETIVSARISQGPGLNGKSPSHCLVAWVQPVDDKNIW